MSAARPPRIEELVELVDEQLSDRPALVGISGAVGVGKSTIGNALVAALGDRGRRGQVLTTDAFLLPNEVLAARKLMMRKGFPESYDADALEAALRRIKSAEWPVRVPVYSHEIYDIVPDEVSILEPSDLVVVDGVIALQEPAAPIMDARIYVDADEELVRGWFIERFLGFVGAARSDEHSFYRAFVHMTDEEVRAVAEATWDGINGVNLREHIGPSKRQATVVVRKGPGHEIVCIERTGAAPR